MAAAPGVVLDPPHEIVKALENPDKVILDIRSIEEIQAQGYWSGTGH